MNDGRPVLELRSVGLTRDGRDILDGVEWTVRRGECWVVLGANGSGKTSLARIASLYQHPSRGTVDVLGERLGRTDVRRLSRPLPTPYARTTLLACPNERVSS